MSVKELLTTAIREHRSGRLAQARELYAEVLRSVPGDATTLHYMGVTLYQLGDFDAAEEMIRNSLQANPGDAEAHNNLGNVLQKQGRLEEAAAAHRDAVRLAPGFFGAHYNLGNALESLGKVEEAEQAFRETIRLKPDHARAHNNLGLMLKRQGKTAAASQAFRRAIAADPSYLDALTNLGAVLVARQDWQAAEDVCRRLLAARPADASATTNLALVLSQLKRFDEAIIACERAIALSPDAAEAHDLLCFAWTGLKQFEKAVAAGRKAVDLSPDGARARINLGVALIHLEKYEEAAEHLLTATELAPDNADGHSALGAVYHCLRLPEEAETACRRAVALSPDLAGAHANLGVALLDLKKIKEAVAALRKACALQPDSPNFNANLAAVLMASNRYEEAIAAFKRSVALDPDYPEGYGHMGAALSNVGRFEEAVAACRRALELKPDWLDPHFSLAGALCELKKPEEAETVCRHAIEIAPDHHGPWTTLCSALMGQHRVDEAITAARRAIEIEPADPIGHINLAVCLSTKGMHVEAMEAMEAAFRAAPTAPGIFKTILCFVPYLEHLDNDSLKILYLRIAADMARGAEPLPAAPRDDPARSKLRVGYLSSDFRQHPVAGALLPPLRHFDRSAFELHLYSVTASPDPTTADFRSLADGWHDVRYLSDVEIAERIRDDGIDILVTVAGRFDANRPAVCCYRGAPIQISLHDAATTALPGMDYIVGDRWTMPPNSSEYFSERRLRLPHWYIAEFPKDLPAIVESPTGMPPVFGSFNNPGKLAPSLLRLWGRILAEVPDARMFLHYMDRYKNGETRSYVLNRIKEGGASPDQVEFKEDGSSREDYLAQHNRIDVALDSFPFSGSTTSYQALCMGVPVVTWPWDRMVSTWTVSVLQPIGLGELVAHSADEYVSIAVDVARHPEIWRPRRPEIRQRLANSPICDPTGWMRNMERLYKAVWRRHCRDSEAAARDASLGVPLGV